MQLGISDTHDYYVLERDPSVGPSLLQVAT